MRKRIWELDALRGLAVIAMVAFHLFYDLVDLYGIWDSYPTCAPFLQKWSSTTFILLSGLCVTLGSHSVKRGLTVFFSGMLVSAVTVGMYLLDFADRSIIIYFGVLHCLGCCMLLWGIFRKAPWWLLALLGVGFFAGGNWLEAHVTVSHIWLVPLGITPASFASSDYFPLISNLGLFLLGAALGKLLYKQKRSLLPSVNGDALPLRLLCAIGSRSLPIYLLHQPVLAGICMLITLWKG